MQVHYFSGICLALVVLAFFSRCGYLAIERQRAGVENNRQKADAGGNEEAEVDDNTRRFIIRCV